MNDARRWRTFDDKLPRKGMRIVVKSDGFLWGVYTFIEATDTLARVRSDKGRTFFDRGKWWRPYDALDRKAREAAQ